MSSKLERIIQSIPLKQEMEQDFLSGLCLMYIDTLPHNWERMSPIQRYKYIMNHLSKEQQIELQMALVNGTPKRKSFNDEPVPMFRG